MWYISMKRINNTILCLQILYLHSFQLLTWPVVCIISNVFSSKRDYIVSREIRRPPLHIQHENGVLFQLKFYEFRLYNLHSSQAVGISNGGSQEGDYKIKIELGLLFPL